jgi:hypothetical protein
MTQAREEHMRKPSQADLELVVGHFLHHLSNTVDKTGLSPRTRFYGSLPVQAKLLFPNVPTEVITSSVDAVIETTESQIDPLSRLSGGDWRSYS